MPDNVELSQMLKDADSQVTQTGDPAAHKSAVRKLERVVRDEPKSAPARAYLAEAYRRLGRYGDALKALDKAIALDPKWVQALAWRGRILLSLGRPADAAKTLEKAMKLEPRHLLAAAWRGEARFKLGKYKDAAEDFKRILPLDPRRTWTPAAVEGSPMSAEACAKAFWDDVSKAVQKRPGDRWARKLWEDALRRVPTMAPEREEALA